MHADVSGPVDYLEPDDARRLERLRSPAAGYAPPTLAPWARDRREAAAPAEKVEDLEGLLPVDGGSQVYETHEIIARLVDGSEFDEYKARYGRTLLCGTARLGGFPIGIVANQKQVVKNRGRLEVGGVIYAEAADKAARFILNCNQAGVPIVFLHDVNGFMVGVDSEQDGIIRRGAKMVNAVSNSVVPRISVILGGSYGAGHYAMSGKAYAPRFVFALPSARYAVMGGQQAARTILDIRAAQRKRSGEASDDEALEELYQRIREGYERALDIRYGAARLWVDAVVLPLELRERLIGALEACALEGELQRFSTGVFQV